MTKKLFFLLSCLTCLAPEAACFKLSAKSKGIQARKAFDKGAIASFRAYIHGCYKLERTHRKYLKDRNSWQKRLAGLVVDQYWTDTSHLSKDEALDPGVKPFYTIPVLWDGWWRAGFDPKTFVHNQIMRTVSIACTQKVIEEMAYNQLADTSKRKTVAAKLKKAGARFTPLLVESLKVALLGYDIYGMCRDCHPATLCCEGSWLRYLYKPNKHYNSDNKLVGGVSSGICPTSATPVQAMNMAMARHPVGAIFVILGSLAHMHGLNLSSRIPFLLYSLHMAGKVAWNPHKHLNKLKSYVHDEEFADPNAESATQVSPAFLALD